MDSLSPLKLLFSVSIVLAILSLFPLPINFITSLFISAKMLTEIFIEIALILQIKLRSDILRILSLTINGHGIYLHLFCQQIQFIRVLQFSFFFLILFYFQTLHNCISFVVFFIQSLYIFVRFIPKHFILGSTNVNDSVFLISNSTVC